MYETKDENFETNDEKRNLKRAAVPPRDASAAAGAAIGRRLKYPLPGAQPAVPAMRLRLQHWLLLGTALLLLGAGAGAEEQQQQEPGPGKCHPECTKYG